MMDQAPQTDLINVDSAAQFSIYRNAYRARLVAALRENFETLPPVMGDDAFDELADAYISAKPSTHYSLRWYGHRLAEFMAENEALVAHPAMIDLARMEWALRTAFDAESTTLLTTAELAALPPDKWPELRLCLHASVQMLRLAWAVGPVWSSLKAGQSDLPVPDMLVHNILVWRKGLQPQWKSLTDAENIFMLGLESNQCFGELCENLSQIVGEADAAPAAAMILRELIENGVIAGL